MVEAVDRRAREARRGVKASPIVGVNEGPGSMRVPVSHLNEPNVECEIVASSSPLVAVRGRPESATAFASAYNDWLLENRPNQSLRKARHPAHTTGRCPRYVAR